ncbi:MAG: J domain-containing protein [Candidatus Nanoarchaeia archaeon]
MVKINVKGHEIEAITIKDSFSRRAMQIKNNLISTIGRLGINVDDIHLDLETNAIKKAPASVSWYINNQHLHYSHNSRNKYVENLYVVSKIIELEINALLEGKRTVEEFIDEFSEHHDVAKKRIEARATLGLDPEVNDLNVINKAYKDLAKEHHPDTESGNTEKFKEINHAHKILKRELR